MKSILHDINVFLSDVFMNLMSIHMTTYWEVLYKCVFLLSPVNVVYDMQCSYVAVCI